MLKHLDDTKVRKYMSQELKDDISSGKVYLSKFQTPQGQGEWPSVLGQAIKEHDADWLINELSNSLCWLTEYEKRKPNGGTTMVRVPVTASETLANGEFQKYYLRGVALLAIDTATELIVTRIREVTHPRSQSEALIGTSVDAQQLLDDLRLNNGIDSFLGIPAGPNSGLGVEIQ
jgi:hypothetical protein